MAESVADPPAALSVRCRAGRVVLLTAVLGSSLAGIDATVVGIALPQIGRTLDASFAYACRRPMNAPTSAAAG